MRKFLIKCAGFVGLWIVLRLLFPFELDNPTLYLMVAYGFGCDLIRMIGND